MEQSTINPKHAELRDQVPRLDWWLVQTGARVRERFARAFVWLKGLRRRDRRRLKRRWRLSLAMLALLLAMSGMPIPAHAASITVTPGAAGLANDGKCSLAEAIINANNHAATWGDCVAGSSGANTITLPTNATLNYASALDTNTALPRISSQVTIEGQGSTIKRDSAASTDFRIVWIYGAYGGNLTLNNVTISGGQVTEMDVGGGIWNGYGTLVVNNSTISGNTAGQGGGIESEIGSLTVKNSTISGNTSSGEGAGVAVFGNTMSIANSTISGNISSAAGGGIFASAVSGSITNSTITGNSVNGGSFQGGGLYTDSMTGHTLTLTRTIISGNVADEYSNEIFGGGITTDTNVLGHNYESISEAFSGFTPGATDIVATSDGGTPTALADILNTTLANNGGPTKTHVLTSHSPAIDAAAQSACAAAPVSALDQRGLARDDLGCDAGAVELRMTDSNWVQRDISSSKMITFGPARAGMQFSGTDPGLVTATKVTNWTGGTPTNAIGAWWDLSAVTNTGLTLTLELCYLDGESNSKTLGSLSFWRYSSSAWSLVGAPSSTNRDAKGNNCATITGVTDLSRWTLATGNPGSNPTAVTLSSFQANAPSFDLWRWLKSWFNR